jgi:predicted O-methyltransferase YrrM
MRMPKALKPYLRPIYVPIANLHYRLFRKPRRYKYLFQTIKQIHPQSLVEVGTWNGNRALQMLAAMHAASPDKKIAYYGFDLFEGMTDEVFVSELSKRPPTEAEVKEKLSRSGASITLYKGDTNVILPQIVPTLPKIDLVFIDGGHAVETIRNDWNQISKLMHERTVVIFDDYWRNRTDAGCKAVVDAIDKNKYSVEVLPIVDSFNNKKFGRLDISFARVALQPKR